MSGGIEDILAGLREPTWRMCCPDHCILRSQRDALKEALEKLIKKCEDEVECSEGCWNRIRETVARAEKTLDTVKDNP